MKHSLLITASPDSPVHMQAIHFAEKLYQQNHIITRIFFFGPAVYVALNTYQSLISRWQQLAQQHNVPFSLCSGSAEKAGISVDRQLSAFDIAGLGEWIFSTREADALSHFGRQAPASHPTHSLQTTSQFLLIDNSPAPDEEIPLLQDMALALSCYEQPITVVLNSLRLKQYQLMLDSFATFGVNALYSLQPNTAAPARIQHKTLCIEPITSTELAQHINTARYVVRF